LFPAFQAAESLIALTRDAALLDSVRAVAEGRPVSAASNEVELAAQLMNGRGSIALIDAAGVTGPVNDLTERLKTQFPDLILVVAGGSQDQAALNAQIGKGQVYRFLHKPLSEQRVKLAVDAAWRRHTQILAGITSAATIHAIPALRPQRSLRFIWIGAALAVLAVGAIGLMMSKSDPLPPVKTVAAPTPAPIQQPAAKTVEAPPETIPTVEVIASKEKPATPPPAAELTPAITESEPVLEAPLDEEAESKQFQLIAQLMGEARKAYAANDLEAGERWTQAVREAGASEDNLNALAREADRVRLARSTDTAIRNALEDGSHSNVKAESIAAVERQILAVRMETRAPRAKIHHVDPDFPSAARQSGTSGWVDLDLTLQPDGTVSNAAVMSATPSGLFDKAAAAAARKWRYEPLESGSPETEQHLKVRIRFELK
jgi:TonB family protein